VTVDGQALWLIAVLGKGDKPREAILYDDIKQLLDQHHRDMERAGTHLVPEAKQRLRTLNNPEALPPSPAPSSDLSQALGVAEPPATVAEFDGGLRPLIGSLHPGIKPRRVNDLGVLELATQESVLSDVHGWLDPNALYLSLKRVLKGCAARADE
ncbi:M3 family metallopeptidase, partial [Escherichia coli]|uniref:M3 family metallopeptidase n=1 Tax=Escherichia coli TaxID=562 RepID=UPI00137B6059